jgi:hypothetical protein
MRSLFYADRMQCSSYKSKKSTCDRSVGYPTTRLAFHTTLLIAPSIYQCRSQINMFNPLNAKLNPICHLLASLGAHHILHVSGIRVKMLN